MRHMQQANHHVCAQLPPCCTPVNTHHASEHAFCTDQRCRSAAAPVAPASAAQRSLHALCGPREACNIHCTWSSWCVHCSLPWPAALPAALSHTIG